MLAALLRLDEVTKSGVESTLKEIASVGSKEASRKVARFEIRRQGRGGPLRRLRQDQIKGKYRFDLHSKRIDWLAMLIQEDREQGFIEDGVEVGSRLQMTIAPANEPASLADEVLAKLTLTPTEELTQLV